MSQAMYLKGNVRTEPLFNQWYAWPMLLQPATASNFVFNHHLRVMESFVQNPSVHAQAVRNPALRGGPFLDYDGPVEDVSRLIESTRRDLKPLLELSAAIAELDDLLHASADGYSLEGLYSRVPEPLGGLVELGYDLRNNPSVRFIEGLLYRSRYYMPEAQSLLLGETQSDYRPFVLSSPRFPDREQVQLRVPFDRPILSDLFRMKTRAASVAILEEVSHECGLSAEEHARLLSYFSEEAPVNRPGRVFGGEGVRVRYFGHATILIESSSTSVLIDPVISYDVDSDIERFTYSDLPEHIDYVLLTHNHQDHVMFESLLQIRHKVGTVLVPKSSGGQLQDPSLKLILERIGFRDVRELDEMEEVGLDTGRIVGVPFFGEHGDLSIRSKLAYLIELKGKKILAVADSNNIDDRLYDHIFDCIGPVDHLFVGMECEGAPLSWIYGPLYTKNLDRKMDKSRRLNGSDGDRAFKLVSRFSPESVNVYAMGMEPWLGYLSSIAYTSESLPIVESNKLIEMCTRQQIDCKRLYAKHEVLAA